MDERLEGAGEPPSPEGEPETESVGTPVEAVEPRGVRIEPRGKKIEPGKKADGGEFELVSTEEGAKAPSGRLVGRSPSGRLLKPRAVEDAGPEPAPAPVVAGSAQPRPPAPSQGGMAKQLLLLLVLLAVGGFLWAKKLNSSQEDAPGSGARTPLEHRISPESEAPLVVASDDLPPPASPTAWPPAAGQPCPSLELLDMQGFPVRLDAFKGKVLIVQAGSMSDQATRQVSSAEGLRTSLKTAGVDPDDEELVFAQVLIHDEEGKPSPSVTQAQAWAARVDLASWGNAFTLITDERFDNAASKAAIGKVYLVGRSFQVVQEASTSELDALACLAAKELSAPYITLCPVETHPKVDGVQAAVDAERASARRLKLLAEGAFERLEAEFSRYGFGEGLEDAAEPLILSDEGAARLTLLDRWCKASRSSLPRYIRGRFLINYAWDARGGGWGSGVSKEAWRLFGERLLRARADLEEAYQLEPRSAAAASSRITVAMGLNEEPTVALEWFKSAVKAERGYYMAYSRLHTFLMPKWHGNEKAMFEFARSAATEHGDDDPRFMSLIVNSHMEASRGERRGASAYLRQHREELEGAFARFVKAHDAGHAYWRWASFAHEIGEVDRFYTLTEKAAEAGHAASQQNLAKFLREGKGMPKDVERGMHMLCRSAAQGRATAQETLGRMLFKGEFVRRDREAALRLLEAAARERDRPKLDLARYYLAGVAAKRDPIAAVRYLKAAAVNGNKQAAEALETTLARRPWLEAEVGEIRRHPAGFEDWYPRNIDPPYETKYPCQLTALPGVLGKLPVRDQRYLNHVCAMILFMTQTKLQTLRYMARAWVDLERIVATASQDYSWALERIEAEPVPEGLEGFQEQILAAFTLQRAWFPKAAEHIRAERRRANLAWNRQPNVSAQRFNKVLGEMFTQIPEAKQAAGKLLAAWGVISKRYAKLLDKAALDSINHHLCAVDFF